MNSGTGTTTDLKVAIGGLIAVSVAAVFRSFVKPQHLAVRIPASPYKNLAAPGASATWARAATRELSRRGGFRNCRRHLKQVIAVGGGCIK
jgi:hypothetical protein